MVMASKTLPVGENHQVTLSMPELYALAVRRVDDHTVRVYYVQEKDILPLLSDDVQVEWPENVLKFSLDKGIVGYVGRAIQVVKEVFRDADRVATSLKEDEYGDPYVDILAIIHDDPDTEAHKYSICVEKWASFIPPNIAGSIHLSTGWASS